MLAVTTPQIPVLHAIVLGITQGLSEFLPISSSGHLIMVPWLFGWTELQRFPDVNKTFGVALHLGTFLGVAVFFRRELAVLIPAGLRAIVRRRIDDTQERLAVMLAVSAVPGAIAGVLLESIVEETLGAPWLVAVMLIVFGGGLFLADRAARKLQEDDFGLRQALIMGVAQAAALQPGVSRSGVTISAGRLLGFDRDSAARLSFLMSMPIIGGAAAYKGVKLILNPSLMHGLVPAFFWGTLASAVTGMGAIALLLRIVRGRSFTPFVVYRAMAGAAALGLIVSGFRPAT